MATQAQLGQEVIGVALTLQGPNPAASPSKKPSPFGDFLNGAMST